MSAKPSGRAPKLTLSVQYAVTPPDAPSREQLRKWARAALQADATATVRIVGEEEGQALNRDYRGKDYATNVLTFAYAEDPPYSGDLVLCAPVVSREAAEQGKSAEAHYAHLIVHGMLHLQGYDHEDEAEAREMEMLEAKIVTGLGYADPYSDEVNTKNG
jgi:probable rRNA maturation factor